MSTRYLGDTLDIHGGGIDLIFPHHENEIAQSEAYSGVEPFVRYWLHNGWLYLGEEKMSKSLGNIIPIAEALPKYGSDGCRLFVLGSHYRSPLTYSEDGLEASKRAAERLRLAVAPAPAGKDTPVDPQPFRQRFIDSMEDDMNAAQAVGALFDLAREINRGRDEGRPLEEAQATLRELAGVLGLTLAEEETGIAARPFIDLLVKVRDELRAAKLFELSDSIRARLAELGVALEDGAEGTRWRRRD
jgi:cysteinyl-tRNA synthetase